MIEPRMTDFGLISALVLRMSTNLKQRHLQLVAVNEVEVTRTLPPQEYAMGDIDDSPEQNQSDAERIALHAAPSLRMVLLVVVVCKDSRCR